MGNTFGNRMPARLVEALIITGGNVKIAGESNIIHLPAPVAVTDNIKGP